MSSRTLRTALAATILAASTISVSACGTSKEEERCREHYRAQQTAQGRTPTTNEVKEACDKDGSHRRSYYNSSSGRGGGSGSGK